MVKLSLQFHACRSEVAAWVASWAQEMELFVAQEFFVDDYRAELVNREQLTEGLSISNAVGRLSLSLYVIDPAAISSLDYMRRNPHVLTVSLGAQSDVWLRESALAAMTDDEPSLAAWKAIRTKAKRSMYSGASVVSPISNERLRLTSHYYSQGARELAALGVLMLASAGWNEYRFDS